MNIGLRSFKAIATAAFFVFLSALQLSAQTVPASASNNVTVNAKPHTQIHALKVTMLSENNVGEWGFAALVEADGHRILVDTGARPETVLINARELKIDLSNVQDVILTHNHDDHVGGLLTLRREYMKINPSALSRVHVGKGIFYSRPAAGDGEDNPMIAIAKQYRETGGEFIEHDGASEIYPGLWLSGPVPRIYPEHNWSTKGKVQTPAGLVEDTIPEDQSLVVNTPQGLVLVSGCGHAGFINTLTFAQTEFPKTPVLAAVGGFHLFPATDAQLDWTSDKLKEFGLSYLIGAHCTGIESVYRIRQRLGLTRASAVVGGVGATFVLGEGIHSGPIAK
jgi:7,8-dihydropterin-6-yl-methyl-4-(beta-D-ribofuranosyl)aminobenzene 5'-phosphate synthase